MNSHSDPILEKIVYIDPRPTLRNIIIILGVGPEIVSRIIVWVYTVIGTGY